MSITSFLYRKTNSQTTSNPDNKYCKIFKSYITWLFYLLPHIDQSRTQKVKNKNSNQSNLKSTKRFRTNTSLTTTNPSPKHAHNHRNITKHEICTRNKSIRVNFVFTIINPKKNIVRLRLNKTKRHENKGRKRGREYRKS